MPEKNEFDLKSKLPKAGLIDFEFKDGKFFHNKKDYAFFAIWRDSFPFLEEIRVYLNDNFEVLSETKIIWSEDNLHDNAARLYEAPIYSNIKKSKRRSGHLAKIGSNEFIAFVVLDLYPDYGYEVSVSKNIELSNRNVIKAKYQFRDWVKNQGGPSYAIHSTNNIQEFCFQAPLVFGYQLLKKIIGKEKLIPSELNKDLEGAVGWDSYLDLFNMLNLGADYLILRNFESLPDENPEADLDLLTDNYQRLASLIGMEQSPTKPYKGVIIVAGEEVKIDIRFLGDEYFPAKWQQSMLSNKIFNGLLFHPRYDDYFFSLLYHCKIHKFQVKPTYNVKLSNLARQLQLTWFTPSQLDDDYNMGKILAGYFKSHQLIYQNPIDDAVGKNRSMIPYLPQSKDRVPQEKIKMKVKRKLIAILPKNIISLLQKIKGKF
ncbi:hypothetical protein [Mongoliitalea daihaiensis]|uniref:hypothetical protein n=1 Tax=Mongoliitalea daihaiensis TaxID=2782006 RepID=UPI001F3927A0|nr:hypothetical protein [Mongoliitalea daihaiensis]UJP64178.1 hypothetical protein IPZ59_15355 [Mongoliitalea daihaiensis]